MGKVLTGAVVGMAVLACGLLLGCQARTPGRAEAVALVEAIQNDDQKRARELAQWWWRPILEREERLHLGNEFYFPIHVAAGEGRVAILKAMIKQGEDIDARDDSGYTPVMWTRDMGPAHRKAERLQCLRLLARAGANLDARSRSSRQTALHQAANSGDVVFVRELVKFGANVGIRMRDGSTPLHVACQALLPANAPEPIEIAKILIEAGADVTAKNDAGETPVDVARKEGREQLVALLRAAAAKGKDKKGGEGKKGK